jgi:carbonic anhydrase
MMVRAQWLFHSLIFPLCLLACAEMPASHPVRQAQDPVNVLESLKNGNQRFVHGELLHPRQGPDERLALAKGQAPGAIVLSCADSRVPPEVLFDQGLGDLFVVRVAGNIAGPAEVASIEYALEHLGSRLLVVMGHDSCGAVNAALSTPPGKSAGSPDLDRLVSEIQRNLAREHFQLKSADPANHNQAMANVDAVAEDLRQRSEIVRERVEKGDLRIVRSIYDLSTGQVEFWSR